jgi:5-formyltetrahydrofolate cyclo-ligase
MQCWHSAWISTISVERVECPILACNSRTGDRVTTHTKAELRRELLTARRAMTAPQRQDQDLAVRAAVTSWLVTVSPATVAAYTPMIGEPGGPELPDALAAHAPRLLLPVLLADRDLDWAEFSSTEALAPARFGLTEPTGPRLGTAAIGEADVVLVPALAADRRGARLGRGGGSYDRALARVRPPQLVIALLYAGELMASVPVEAHDRPVDGVATSEGVMIFAMM